MANIPHVRAAIVNPATGIPTTVFYDLLAQLTGAADIAETIVDTIYQITDFGSQTSLDADPNALLWQQILTYSLPLQDHAHDNSKEIAARIALRI